MKECHCMHSDQLGEKPSWHNKISDRNELNQRKPKIFSKQALLKTTGKIVPIPNKPNTKTTGAKKGGG